MANLAVYWWVKIDWRRILQFDNVALNLGIKEEGIWEVKGFSQGEFFNWGF